MYEARFTTKQVYDTYSKSLGKPKSKPAKSRSLGGFEPDPAQRTSTKKSAPTVQTRDRRRDRRGSTYDEVPQVLTQGIVKRPTAKPVKETGYEKVKRVFNNAMERLGIVDEPTSTYDTVKPQNIYKSALFSVPEVTTTTLPDMAPAIASNFGLSMGVDPYDPRGRDQRRLPQNVYQNTVSTIFTGGGRDEPVKGRFGNMYRPGLMSPPTMDQTKPETPGLTIEDAVNRAILATTKEYVIKPGDTLTKIARRNNTTVKELAEINKIEDVDVIKAGASLRVPKSTMTDTQAAIRRGYERVKPDDGVEVATYNPLTLALPPLQPDVRFSYRNTSKKLVDDLMRDFGLTKVQASAMAGNLAQETGRFQFLQEKKPTVKGSKGGYGFAQWTGPRRKAYEEWAEENELDINTYEANYGYLKEELENRQKGTIEGMGIKTIKNLKKMDDIDEATQYISEYFLRPSKPHMNRRKKYAKQILEMVK